MQKLEARIETFEQFWIFIDKIFNSLDIHANNNTKKDTLSNKTNQSHFIYLTADATCFGANK